MSFKNHWSRSRIQINIWNMKILSNSPEKSHVKIVKPACSQLYDAGAVSLSQLSMASGHTPHQCSIQYPPAWAHQAPTRPDTRHCHRDITGHFIQTLSLDVRLCQDSRHCFYKLP